MQHFTPNESFKSPEEKLRQCVRLFTFGTPCVSSFTRVLYIGPGGVAPLTTAANDLWGSAWKYLPK